MVPTEQEAGWASLDVGGGRKTLEPTRIQNPDCPACSLVAVPPILLWILLYPESQMHFFHMV